MSIGGAATSWESVLEQVYCKGLQDVEGCVLEQKKREEEIAESTS